MDQTVGTTKKITIANGELSISMPNATPMSMLSSWNRTAFPTAAAVRSQVPAPSRALAVRQAISARPRLGRTDRMETRTLAASLAAMTRWRSGTSAKVVRAVRWDHSLVTERMPSTGSRIPTASRVIARNAS